MTARQPCAGWTGDPDRELTLRVGWLVARAVRHNSDSTWTAEIHTEGGALVWRDAEPWGRWLVDAQLAAEDALLAVADAIRRAISG